MSSKIPFLPDLLITLPSVLLLSFGILVIYSSDRKLALQQGVFALIGLLLYWGISSLEFDLYKHYTKYLYGITIFLLIDNVHLSG